MRRILLNRLLMLQMAYCFAGIMYNVGSLLAQRNGRAAWASTDAVTGVAGVAVYGVFLSAGLMKNLTLYRVLMGVAVVLLGYGGVVTHLLNVGHLELYQSAWTWAGAIGINGFGLGLNLVAALGWFAPRVEEPWRTGREFGWCLAGAPWTTAHRGRRWRWTRPWRSGADPGKRICDRGSKRVNEIPAGDSSSALPWAFQQDPDLGQ